MTRNDTREEMARISVLLSNIEKEITKLENKIKDANDDLRRLWDQKIKEQIKFAILVEATNHD